MLESPGKNRDRIITAMTDQTGLGLQQTDKKMIYC